MTLAERPISHRVLLVDDDDAIREMMTATLAHKGFEVVAAANVTQTDHDGELRCPDHGSPHAKPQRWGCGDYRNAPHPTEGTYAAGQRLPRREECDGRYPSGGG